MNHKKKVEVFQKELEKFLDRAIIELRLTNAELIGTIELTLIKIKTNAVKQNEKK